MATWQYGEAFPSEPPWPPGPNRKTHPDVHEREYRKWCNSYNHHRRQAVDAYDRRQATARSTGHSPESA